MSAKVPVSTPRPSGAHASSAGPVVRRRGEQLGLGVAGEQGVLGLHGGRDRRRPPRASALGDRGELPAGRPDEPHVADPAGRHRRVGDGEGLVERDVGVPAGELPQVEVVRVQAAQEPVQPAQQGPAPRAAAVRAVAEQAAAGEHEIVARHRPAQEAREDVLRDAAAVAVGGLDEGPARLDEHAQLVRRGVAVGVVAPRHRAQADPRHLQPAAAHPSSLHVGQPKRVLTSSAARRARRARNTLSGDRRRRAVPCGAVTFSARTQQLISANGTNPT